MFTLGGLDNDGNYVDIIQYMGLRQIPTSSPTSDPTNPTIEPTVEPSQPTTDTTNPTMEPTVEPSQPATDPTEATMNPTSHSKTSNENISNKNDIIIWIVIGVFVVITSLSLFIYYSLCYTNKQINGQYIKNGLVAIIAIGDYEYDDDIMDNPDIIDGYLIDLPVDRDIENLEDLFNLLNYKVIPNKFKMSWTEHEVIDFLTNDIGKELFDDNNELRYDGLIVCVSCHGMENKIITSDYRTIEKSVIHRIISINHPKAREIPRIFLFDSCDGSAQREYIRASTINTSQYVAVSDEKEEEKNDVDVMDKAYGKCTELKDISADNAWTHTTKNPDYKLVQIHASNPGFQAKCCSSKGSYLIYEFTQKILDNLDQKQNKSLTTICEEIQNKLHDLGKQQTTNVFNNGTGHLQFVKNTKTEAIHIDTNDEHQDLKIELAEFVQNIPTSLISGYKN